MYTEYQEVTMHTEYRATNNAHRIIVYENNFYPKTQLTSVTITTITQAKIQNNVLAHTPSAQQQNSTTILFTSC
jgi:hypothetical protein